MIVSAIRRPSPSAILRSLVGLALLALACERTPPAEPVALALPPKTTIADVHIRLGKVRLNEGLAREALEELDAALAESPDLIEALVLRARALALLSEVDPAIETFQKAVALGDDSPETRLMLATALCQSSRLKQAEPIYVELLAEFPEHAAAAKGYALLLIDLDRLDEAVRALERALELDPDAAGVALLLGDQLRRIGETERARAVLERSHELHPDHAEIAYQLGLVRRDTGDTAGASAAFRAALENDRYHTGALNQLIRAAQLDGVEEADSALLTRFQEAQNIQSVKERLRAELHHDRTHVDFLGRLATLEASTGNYEEAAGLFGRLVMFQPGNRAAVSNLGRSLMKLGRADEALGPLGRAAMLEPDNPLVQLDLAEARLAVGDRAGTTEPLARARALLEKSAGQSGGQLEIARRKLAGLTAAVRSPLP